MTKKEKIEFVRSYLKEHDKTDSYTLKKNLFGQWKIYYWRDCMHEHKAEPMPLDKFIELIHKAEEDEKRFAMIQKETEAKMNSRSTDGISVYLNYKRKQNDNTGEN